MIKVEVVRENDVIKEILLKGHALYDDMGKDIVCAYVSGTVICSINGINGIDINYLDIDKQKDLIRIIVLKNDKIVDTLLINMLNCLKNMEKKYSSNIKIYDKEEGTC